MPLKEIKLVEEVGTTKPVMFLLVYFYNWEEEDRNTGKSRTFNSGLLSMYQLQSHCKIVRHTPSENL